MFPNERAAEIAVQTVREYKEATGSQINVIFNVFKDLDLNITSDIFEPEIVWCRGYYVDTVGKNTAAIKAYIQNQLKEDLEYDQMSFVEYIDPFTGEPVKKNKR